MRTVCIFAPEQAWGWELGGLCLYLTITMPNLEGGIVLQMAPFLNAKNFPIRRVEPEVAFAHRLRGAVLEYMCMGSGVIQTWV